VQPYSPERRTALVLCGTGAHGAYHAGALKALQEAGVKIDVMAGQGVGAAAAALGAIDGAARLWEADGIWRHAGVRTWYQWKWPVRVAGWLAAFLVAALAAPIVLSIFRLQFNALPFAVLAFALLCVVVACAGVSVWRAQRHAPVRRRADGAWWWRLAAAPLGGDAPREAFAAATWQLIRGAATTTHPPAEALGRRYAEVLAESLGQPGFRELMIVTTDLDARHDVVGAFLREPYREAFTAPRRDRERLSEAFDLADAGREHAFALVAGALTPPGGCDPYLMTFSAESYWRGETHRLCDRPGAISRLLEELAAAGVSQAIIVSAVPAPPSPHRLTTPRLELRHRLGEYLVAAESAALRDAIEMARLRFDSVYLIRPPHNPVGAFDVGGAYDEASDRHHGLGELMDGAYEDAYQQFIEPVVGASGEQIARVGARPTSRSVPV
jgi:hypothetical protein